jgi:hypothetical protein
MSYPGGPAGPQQPPYPNGAHDVSHPFPSGPVGPPVQSAPPVSGQPGASPLTPPPGHGPYPAPYSGGGAYGYDFTAPAPSAASPVSGTGPTGQEGSIGGRRHLMTVPLLASLLVVFVLATAVLAVLYAGRNSDYNDQKKAAEQRQEQLARTSSDLKKVQETLARVESDLSTAKRDLATSQARADELGRQKTILWKCLQLLNEAAQAEVAGNAALAQQKSTEAVPICKEALAIPG